MRINKKTDIYIKEHAAFLKRLYETPNPEEDRIVNELRESAKNMPKNMNKEEKIAYILKGGEK